MENIQTVSTSFIVPVEPIVISSRVVRTYAAGFPLVAFFYIYFYLFIYLKYI